MEHKDIYLAGQQERPCPEPGQTIITTLSYN